MKKIFTNYKKILFYSVILFFVASCNKENINQNTAELNVINFCPDGPQLINTTVNGNLAFGEYFTRGGNSSIIISGGTNNIKIASNQSPNNYIIDSNINLEGGKFHTAFLIDSFAKIKLFVTSDILATPQNGKANIRFFNFSPNSPAVDVVIKDQYALATNRSFNDENQTTAYTNFNEIPIGTYTLQVKESGTNNVIYEASNISLYSQKTYTLIFAGIIGAPPSTTISATPTLKVYDETSFFNN